MKVMINAEFGDSGFCEMKQVDRSGRFWLPICLLILVLSACQGNDRLASKTLVLTISTQKGDWKVASSKRINHPYYTGSANEPVYQADMIDGSGKVIHSVFFGKEFLSNNGQDFQLPFPAIKQAQEIIIYRLDASSGHITNKNRDKMLVWRIGK